MLVVILALMPATGFGIYNFGLDVLYLILVTVGTAILCEYISGLLMKRPVTIGDYSAVVTGLLLALTLPPEAPLWLGVVGGIFAVFVVKMLFGGLGQNIMNPAMAARCFLFISFAPFMKVNQNTDMENPKLLDMLFGYTGGGIGETSMIALILGAVFLVILGVIDLKIPMMYIVTFLISLVLLSGNFEADYLITQLVGGGLIIGAFFMATDYATSPITPRGKIIMGIGCGFLTVMIRFYGGYPEGVSYAILIMNLFVPVIDKYVRPRIYGKVKRK